MKLRVGFQSLALLIALLLIGPTAQLRASSIASGPWPTSSDLPVTALPHPSLADHLASLGAELDAGFRLVAYGDQRALADGEWQAMAELIAAREYDEAHPWPLAAILDTGDIVFNGKYSDQFHMMAEIIEPLRVWPYLVGVGNHEVHANKKGPARQNVASLLGPSLDDEFTVDRMYYRRDIGPMRLLSLDTNDIIYGPNHELDEPSFDTARGREQLTWLRGELSVDHDGPTVIVLHHPFLISSRKHEAHAAALWSLLFEGRSLATMFAEGGVDLVLTGHTHTYERFEVATQSGSFQLINVSGRPRNDFMFVGGGSRRARDIRGRELEVLADRGWRDLEGWKITQIEAMTEDEGDQWLELRVAADGSMQAEVFFLVDEGKGGVRSGGSFAID